MTRPYRRQHPNTVPVLILVIGTVLVVGWVLTRLQGICLDYWAATGGDTPPCWLPFGT